MDILKTIKDLEAYKSNLENQLQTINHSLTYLKMIEQQQQQLNEIIKNNPMLSMQKDILSQYQKYSEDYLKQISAFNPFTHKK